VRGAILDLADRLQTNPEVGCMIRGTAKRHDNIRWVVIPRFRNYLLFYRPFRAGIVVVRVLHAARDWTRFFPRRDSRSQ
ncbi:MAG: type II toxin-antitoxin system RelE/ParE family toxin, partial [Verrucomicrobiae bacterium]|nr:type II toxin-antitoxin system RelE/ParE family toxin [Verrucomicrobiae bacterium]